MKLIDTNILIYAAGQPHEYKRDSIRVLAKHQQGEIAANISTEILQEVLHRYRSLNDLAKGIRLFDDLVLQFPQPFPILLSTARIARDVLHDYPRLQSRDAFHAAVVLELGLEGIISADRAFDGIAGVRRFDPKELAA